MVYFQRQPTPYSYFVNDKKLVNRPSDRNGPILIDLDRSTWDKQLDRVGNWLGNTLMAQIAFQHLAIDTIDVIQEPHIRDSIIGIARDATEHIQKVEELFKIIDRNPYYFTKNGAIAIAKFKEAIGRMEGVLGGAGGDWQMLHQLFLSNINALGAFGVTEQFGLLLGLPEIVEIVLPIVHQKETDQLLIKEYMLEMASISIIYKESI